MIITRQDPFAFRLQTGETIVNFDTRDSSVELKMGPKRLAIKTPGEYETEGITIEGAGGAFNGAQKESGIFYTIRWDDMTIGLGGTASRITYDVVLLSVIKPTETIKALADSDARIVIPFGEEKTVAAFLKELDESSEEIEKLTIKKKDIPGEGERKIVMLKPLKK